MRLDRSIIKRSRDANLSLAAVLLPSSSPGRAVLGAYWAQPAAVSRNQRSQPENGKQRLTAFTQVRRCLFRSVVVVVRGGVEPPTFRFSGGRSYRLSYLTLAT
jgi:hypothetical protein